MRVFFLLISRCIIDDRRSRPKNHPELSCAYSGCSQGKTFSRRWELDRHVRVVHQGQKDLRCPYPHCFQKTQASAFSRPDKLTSLIKACHRRHYELLLSCPAGGCLESPTMLDVLAQHIREDHLVDTNPHKQRQRCGEEVEILRAIANAAPTPEHGE